MATDAQIAANRRNARKSTGPRTAEGKAASRFNALRHGLHAKAHVIPGEDPAELENLAAGYYAEFDPQGPTERHYVDRLILCDWLRARYHRIQAEIMRHLVKDNPDAPDPGARFLLEARRGDAFTKIFRQINANDRTYDKALDALTRLQSERQPAEPRPNPEPAELASFRPTAKSPSHPPSSGPERVIASPAPATGLSYGQAGAAGVGHGR